MCVGKGGILHGYGVKREHGIGKGPLSSPSKLTLGTLTAWVAMRITHVNMLRRPGSPLLTRDNILSFGYMKYEPQNKACGETRSDRIYLCKMFMEINSQSFLL